MNYLTWGTMVFLSLGTMASFIKESLDRALCNFSYHMAFARAQVFHIAIVGSDHLPKAAAE